MRGTENHDSNTRLASAVSLAQSGHWTDAEKACRQILAEHPADADAIYLLGVIYQNSGRPEPAIGCYKTVLSQIPGHPDALNNLGIVLESIHRQQDAIECYRQSVHHNPGHPMANYNLGRMLRRTGKVGQAVTYLKAAIALSPNSPHVMHELGLALKTLGSLDEALHYLQGARLRSPADASICNVVGNVLLEKGEIQQAITAYNEAIRLKPDFATALNNLGSAQIARGDVRAALDSYRAAASLRPDWTGAASNVLLAENYACENATELFRKHRELGERLEKRHKRLPPARIPGSNRRIRIGYISPDFRAHSVAYFVQGLLLQHDRTSFHVVCFSDVAAPDRTTQQLKSLADDWHNIAGLPDNEVFDRIRTSEIDILVDLAGHTANNRMAIFAMQAAPVQVAYIGYPNSTGLSTVQYRFTDAMADPCGCADSLHTEKLIRLPKSFLCYTPPTECPDVGDLPSDRHDYISFGSFNVLAKISDSCADAWAAILKQTPLARLVLKSAGLQDRETRESLLRRFAERGIDRSRLELLARTPDFGSHMSLYNGIDIGLDTFPYNGTTTTCESLWMGVPVVTLAGNRHASRVGASLLHQVALDEYIANNVDQYVSNALLLAQRRSQLRSIRKQLRATMASGPLCDSAGLTAAIEKEYKAMLS